MAQRHILLHLTPLQAFGDAAREGIARYASIHGNWTCAAVPNTCLTTPGPLPPADGVLGAFVSSQMQSLKRMGARAVVTMLHPEQEPEPGMGAVYSDDVAAGHIAAEHLLERGYRQLGFLPTLRPFAQARMVGVLEVAARHHVPCDVFPLDQVIAEHGWGNHSPHHMRWIDTLPRPLGLIGADDNLAAGLIKTVVAAGLRVPDDIAVIGVTNAILPCLFSQPTLSSVHLDFDRIGFEAATMLNRMMDGQMLTQRVMLIPPVGVVARKSTDMLAIDDPEVVAALRLIRAHPDEAMTVWDVLEAVPMARRSLERKFRIHVGHSPWQEIRRVQIEHVKKLLAHTDLSMPRVAAASAFRDAKMLSTVFRKETGMTPTTYRRQHRIR